jgi:tetratricopeptide (TPR) repeat protein
MQRKDLGRITKVHYSKREEEADLRQRITAGSHDPEAYIALGQLLFSSDRGEEAIAILRRALALPLTNSQQARVSSELGWGFYGMGRHAEAKQLAQSALDLLPEEAAPPEILACQARSYSVIAFCEWANKESDIKAKEAARKAIERYERLMREAPEFEAIGVVYYDASQLQTLLGNNSLGIELCEKYLRSELEDGERGEGLNHLAALLRLENRFVEAEAALQQAFLLAKDNEILLSALYFSEGLLRRSLNRPDDARASFQKALEARQADTNLPVNSVFCGDAYWNLGELSCQARNYSEAINAFEEVLVCHPEEDLDHRNALLWIASCYEAQEKPQAAVVYFKKVLALTSASEAEKKSAKKGLAWNIGKIHYTRQEYKEAISAFKQVATYQAHHDPERYNTLHWLGHSYLGSKDYERARGCYTQITESPYATEIDKEGARKALCELLHPQSKPTH